MADIVSTAQNNSVQTLPSATPAGPRPLFWVFEGRGDILPAWGSRHRERVLLEWDRHERNWMWQGARAGLAKKVASAPNELSGGRNLTAHFRRVLDYADFGAGWQIFIKKVIRDYLRHDHGAFIEIIAPGDPTKPPTGRVDGIAHLDAMRCFPTGDPMFPVVYHDRNGTLHLLHETRVIHLVDMPDGDEHRPGVGECALSRAITIAQRDQYMTKYVDTQLDDKPPPGILTVTGMARSQVEKAVQDYRARQQTDSGSVWGRQLVLTSQAGADPISINTTTFSQATADWQFPEYVNLNANALALALGTDVQEIWQLQGGNLGSGQQSQILHAKSQGKAFGDILTMLERALNFYVLPTALTFEFKRHDPYEATERANTAQVWGNFVNTVGARLSDQEGREVLANQVEAVRDAITDADGQVVRLIDTDPETPDQMIEDDTGATTGEPDVIADDSDGAAGERGKALPNQRPAFASIPLPNHDAVLKLQRALKQEFDDPRIEWQNTPTFHVTLCHASLVSDFGIQQMARDIRVQQMELQAERIDYFDTPDGKAVHIRLNSTTVLSDVQASVYSAFEDNADGLSEYSTPEGYNPHITLAYFPNDISFDPRPIRETNILADTVVITRDNYDPVLTLTAPQFKAIQATRLDFETDFEDLLAAARAGAMTRRQFSIRLRNLLRVNGRKAFDDGLADGGVTGEFSDDDERRFALLLADQSQYVTQLGARLFRDEVTVITDAQAANKPAMWFNKSIQPFYDAGLRSAAANRMMEFVLGATEEHCRSCLSLSGQRHRLKTFLDSGWYPKSSKLACKGFFCDCRLAPTTQPARGRLSSVKHTHIHTHERQAA